MCNAHGMLVCLSIIGIKTVYISGLVLYPGVGNIKLYSTAQQDTAGAYKQSLLANQTEQLLLYDVQLWYVFKS